MFSTTRVNSKIRPKGKPGVLGVDATLAVVVSSKVFLTIDALKDLAEGEKFPEYFVEANLLFVANELYVFVRIPVVLSYMFGH